MNTDQLFIQAILSIAVIVVAARFLGYLSWIIGQPKVVGEMIAGILLGPTCLSHFLPDLSEKLFPPGIITLIFFLSNAGLILYMFLTALEVDFSRFDQLMIKRSVVLTFFLISIPFLGGVLTGTFFYDSLKGNGASPIIFYLFLGCAMAMTAFPVLARILEEKKLPGTKLGTLLLLSASMQDVIIWIFLLLMNCTVEKSAFSPAVRLLSGMLIFPLLLLLSRYWLKVIYKKQVSGKLPPQTYLSALFIFLLASSITTGYIGFHFALGAFAIGLIVPRDKDFTNDIAVKIKGPVERLLLPLFFAFTGLRTNLLILDSSYYLVPAVIIISISFFSKFLTAFITMRRMGFDTAQSTAAGGLMNARGTMELILANIGMTAGIISASLYSILILLAISSTMCAVPIYTISIYKKRKERKEEKALYYIGIKRGS